MIQMETSSESQNSDFDELCEKMKELTRSSSNNPPKSDTRLFSTTSKTNSLHLDNDRSIMDLKIDNNAMRGKLERMHEISAENLLLQSDLADYQAELCELRMETKELRSRCYQLAEDNHQGHAEIRDLRRYIDLLKLNKEGDSRQDLLNKIEYYQMEHERLLDEIRRLNLRLCEISPRVSPRPNSRQMESLRNSSDLEAMREGCRSPVSNAIAASTASSFAANRLIRDRSLSPAAALNYRNLTMDRYRQHMEEEEVDSVQSDRTEELLEVQPKISVNGDHMNGDSHHNHHEQNEMNGDFNQCGIIKNSGESIGEISNFIPNGCRSKNIIYSESNPVPQDSSTPNSSSERKRRSSSSTNKSNASTLSNKSLPTRAFAPRSPADLTLDAHWIKFTRPGGKMSKGLVKFVGHLSRSDGIYVGVELDDSEGEHSGTLHGAKYFSCAENKGVFIPFSKIVMAWE